MFLFRKFGLFDPQKKDRFRPRKPNFRVDRDMTVYAFHALIFFFILLSIREKSYPSKVSTIYGLDFYGEFIKSVCNDIVGTGRCCCFFRLSCKRRR